MNLALEFELTAFALERAEQQLKEAIPNDKAFLKALVKELERQQTRLANEFCTVFEV